MRYLCLHRHELLSFGCTVEMQSVRLKRAGAARHLLEARDFSRVRLHLERESFEPTDHAATEDISVLELVENFIKAKNNWDESLFGIA